MTGGHWSPARRRVAALSGIVAALTATGAILVLGSGWVVLMGVVLVAVTGLGVLRPPTAVATPVAGQLLALALLLDPDPPHLLLLLPVVVGTLLAAELAGVSERLAHPFARDPAPALRRAAAIALGGGAIFGGVAWLVSILAAVPSPTGLGATLLAVGACVFLAVVFARAGRASRAG